MPWTVFLKQLLSTQFYRPYQFPSATWQKVTWTYWSKCLKSLSNGLHISILWFGWLKRDSNYFVAVVLKKTAITTSTWSNPGHLVPCGSEHKGTISFSQLLSTNLTNTVLLFILILVMSSTWSHYVCVSIVSMSFCIVVLLVNMCICHLCNKLTYLLAMQTDRL